MDPTEFTSDASGEVIRVPTGYWAFVPTPPPDRVDYNTLAVLVSEADAQLSELSGLGRYLPNPHLLIAPYIRREAVASSRIEGTQADLSELLLDELAPERRAPDSDVLEVRNYVAAMELGITKLSQWPIAGRFIRMLHGVLLRDVRGQDRLPGEFRRSQNWIGGTSPASAAYVPPPVDRLHDCLAEWERFVHQRRTMPDLVQCAMMHERFEAIHPFLDGNGRIGRLLITLFLMERDRLSQPLLYLSSYIERTRGQYYDALQRVRTHGDWIGWIEYFLTGVVESARQAIRHADALLSLRNDIRQSADLSGKHRAQNLIDHLFANPYISVARAAELLRVTETTAIKSIRLLEQRGILEEITGKNWGRIWVAKPVRDALEQPPV